jgi:prepilin-type processing-associated H-X9-DG protein
MQCTNHQKQVVLAMHNYHDTQQSFPWGARGEQRGTWAMQVLAFVEQNTVASSYNWEVTYLDATNKSVLSNLLITTYSCPSDGKTKPLLPNTEYYAHNLVVCMGREGVYDMSSRSTGTSPLVSPRNCLIDDTSFAHQSIYGAMFNGSCLQSTELSYPITTQMADVQDGTSNTVAISETIQGLSPDGNVNDLRGFNWWGPNCFFNTYHTPNTMIADVTDSFSLTGHAQHPLQIMITTKTAGGYRQRMAARSWHTGGVNAGFADGSVRFVPSQIDLEIWRAVGSTNGGEINSFQ